MPTIRKKKKKRKKKHILLDNAINQEILTLLASGLSQKEIALHFKAQGKRPSTQKSIERRIFLLKKHYKANNLFHLGVIIRQRNHFNLQISK
jgi:hypothetical protein